MLEKLKSKKAILILLGFASFISIGYLLFLIAPSNETNNRGLPLKPKIPVTYEGSFETKLSVTEKEFNFPGKPSAGFSDHTGR